ncbi:MAG: chemotaxis protein CheZ [Alphaproteobacteria bacterium]
MALVSKRSEDRTHFETVSQHLEEIIGSTEDATNTILENVEAINELTEKIRLSGAMGMVPLLRNQIYERATNTIENCTFQDITGQRVSRIIQSLDFVEQRVNAMIELMGRADIESLGITLPDSDQREGDDALLNRPQLPGEEISQDEIDKIFA